MKKESKNTKKNRPTKSVDRQLGSFGLEPPKIYKEFSTNSSTKNSSKNQGRKKEELTKSEVRVKQTRKRKIRKKLRTALILTSVMLFIVIILVVLSLTVFFKIDTITVSGSKIYNNNQILTAMTIDKGENLFISDTKKAEAKLEESLPYIYSVEFERKLPSTLVVKVHDATPKYAIASEDSTFTLLDDNFKVLETGSQDMRNGVLISEATVTSSTLGKTIVFSNDKVSKCLTTLASAIKTYNFTEATAIYSMGLTENYIVYDNRIIFKLGTCDDLENKIYKGLASCEDLNNTSGETKGTLDLSGDKSIYFTEE